MTEGTARLSAAKTRRRLMLAAEVQTEPYDARGTTADGRDVPDLRSLMGQGDALLSQVSDVPPERIHPDDLRDWATWLRKARNQLEAAETASLVQMRNRKVHREDGASSPTKWVAEQLGGSQRDAADQLRTADDLADLPEVAAAFADGDITRESASAIGRAMRDHRVRSLDDAEHRLLGAALQGGPDHVRRTARQIKAAADVEKVERDAARKREQRYGNVWVRDDGMVKVDALLDQDNGEAFVTAYEALFNASMKNDRERDGVGQRTGRQRGADVLGEMARRLLAAGDAPDAAGRAATVLVTIPEAILDGRQGEGVAQMRFTGPVPPSTARRLACDAGIVPVVLNGRSVPVDIGRTSRNPTTAQRRCLQVRDGGCCRMCGRRDRLSIAHHCHHWAHGGSTDLANLILVCWDCHQLLHEGKWDAAWQPDNSVRFTHPDGRRFIRPPPT